MEYHLQPGYELLQRLNAERDREAAGQGNEYTKGVDALVAYDKPDDIRIARMAVPGLNGAPRGATLPV